MFTNLIAKIAAASLLALAAITSAHAGLVRMDWFKEFTGFNLNTGTDTANAKIHPSVDSKGELSSIYIADTEGNNMQYLKPKSMSCDPEATAVCLYLFDARHPVVGSLAGGIEFMVIVKRGEVTTLGQATWEMDAYGNLSNPPNMLELVLFEPAPTKQNTD